MSAIKRNALGKGLGALLEDAQTDITSNSSNGNQQNIAGSVSEL